MKLPIKLNLLLTVKFIYFSNPFRTTFILRFNLPSSCRIRWVIVFWLWNTINITISMRWVSIFPSDMTMISYFNFTINIIALTGPTFYRVLKIFIVFFSHHKFLVKMFFHHFITIVTFFNYTMNEIVNCTFSSVWFKRLTKIIIDTC